MRRKMMISVTVFIFLCFFVIEPSRFACGLEATVVDDDGDKYSIVDIKNYGNVSGAWLKEPQCLMEEIYYSVKKGKDKIYKKIPFSDIKEISFQHDNHEHVVSMQVIKWDGDIIEVDYCSHRVIEKGKGGKIRQYETTEDKRAPGLVGDIKVKDNQLLWQGFVGKELIRGGQAKGIFFIHSSLVKKVIFTKEEPKKLQEVPKKVPPQ